MNSRIETLKEMFIVDKIQKRLRHDFFSISELAHDFAQKELSPESRSALRLISMINAENPVVFAEEKIAFTRTNISVPQIFTPDEFEKIHQNHWVHELGDVSNICVDYTKLLHTGFDATIDELHFLKEQRPTGKEREYIQYQIDILRSIQNLAEKYRQEAIKTGNTTVASSLARVPASSPETFLQALQMLRIIHFAMWCGNNYHNTVGRFDQFMYSWFEADLRAGELNRDTALELIEEFFLTFNRDSDLYPGMQQGDNGQSIVLGGLKEDGSDAFNDLSQLCLEASLNLKVIDPKINLRVHSKTADEVYITGTQLTRQGLGFPQYSNDDIVVPGLIALGYEKKDALNYAVAACWEFIIPGKGMDIPNIEAVSFAQAVEDAVINHLEKCESFENLLYQVKYYLNQQIDELCEKTKNIYIYPAPLLSLMMEECASTGKDVSEGSIYNNYGFHGTGLATAADSLAAIKKSLFEDKTVQANELISAIKNDFKGFDDLSNTLRYTMPKMGQNNDYVDSIGSTLLAYFAESLTGRKNERGGIYRAGTGTAMYYLWHAKSLHASPDGRHKDEGFGCNYSPSLYTKCAGPVSIVQSFAKPNLMQVINGGPLTLELHDTLFRTEDSIRKVAMLVKSFMDLGGHQLQINAVNRDKLLAAQQDPEKYRHLIVRVWGWSGYFVELDKEYQDHVIQRMELVI